MRRPLFWSLFGLSLVALLGLAVAFRGALTKTAVETFLAQRGFPDIHVEAVELGFEQATIVDLTLGPDAPSAKRIVLVYRAGEILGGRIREIRIDGLRFPIDLSEAAPFDRFADLVAGGAGGDDDGPRAAGPKVTLDDAQIILTGTGAGDIGIELGGWIDLSGASADAQLDGRVATDHSQATLKISASDLLDMPWLVVEGNGESDLGRVPWPADLALAPQAGRASFAVVGALPILWREGMNVRSMLDQTGSLTLDLRLEGVSVPHYARDVQVAARLAVDTQDGGLNLRLMEPATLVVGSVEEDGLRQMGLGALQGIDRSGPFLRATLAAVAPDEPALRWSVADEGWRGRIAIALDVELDQGRARLGFEGEVAHDSAFAFRDLAISRLDFEADNLPIGPHRVDRAVLRAEGTASDGELDIAGPLQFAFTRLVADDLTLDNVAFEGQVRIVKSAETTGEFHVQDGDLRIPTRKIRFANVNATIPVDAGKIPDSVRLSAEIRHTAMPAAFPPLGVTLEATEKDAAWRATGQARLLNGGASLPFAGNYEAASGIGKLAVGPGSLDFRGGGLQPADLDGALSDFRNAKGAVKVDGAFSLDPKAGIKGRVRASFDGFSIDTPAGRVEGLSGAIDVNRITPLGTAPRQEVKIKKLIAALPVEDIVVRWRLRSRAGNPVIELEHVEAHVADGMIAFDDATLDPGAPSNDIDLRLERLSLDRLFKDLAIEALSGTGHLSGTIPIRLTATGVVIEDGILRTEEAGVLRVRLGETKQVLERQGEQVALMVQALENFHYESLELRVARPPDGQLELGVHMEGKNPDVMEGQPFRFNISLSGALEPVLSALHDGRALSTDLLRNAMEGAK